MRFKVGRTLAITAVAVAVASPAIYLVSSMSRFGDAAQALGPGVSMSEVVARLGAPERQWNEGFKCLGCYPCDASKKKGAVLFYRRGPGCGFDIGWYFYFDDQDKLVESEDSTT